MNPVGMRWSVLGAVPVALAGTAVAVFIGLSGMESQPAIPHTVSSVPGSIRLADSDQDQLNQMEQQQAQQTAQQSEDLAQQEQQQVDQQNAFNESMTAGNN
ncbi:MAG TPA: hypothetical protein VFI55_08375 [Mycobacterium sp.]|jgi:hypothetical protein|nr:hypothetical protein [Mycobacterium sp.]